MTPLKDGPTTELSKDAATGEPIKIGLLVRRSCRRCHRSPRPARQWSIPQRECRRYQRPQDRPGPLQPAGEDPASATKCANEFVEKKVSVVAVLRLRRAQSWSPSRARRHPVRDAFGRPVEMGAPGAFALSGGTSHSQRPGADRRQERRQEVHHPSSVTVATRSALGGPGRLQRSSNRPASTSRS